MDNKKFIIIFVILILIIVGLVIYSAIFTIKSENSKNNINISIEEFNNIILQSQSFNTSKVSDITEDNLTEIFEIEKENVNKFYGKKSVLNTDASLYLLIEPNEEKYDEVYSKLEEFCLAYEENWSDYLEAEYDIVVDRKIGKINNYIYLVISDDSYDIVKEIEFIK